MKNSFQDLEWAVEKINKKFENNPRRSISATFRYLRKQSHFSLFGDFLLIAIIVDTLYKMKLPVKRLTVLRAFRYSEELKNEPVGRKKLLLDVLLYISTERMKGGKNAHK